MKTCWIKAKALYLAVGALVIYTVANGCGVDSEDFSDTKVIENIIKADVEEVFGVNVANDDVAATVLPKTSNSDGVSNFAFKNSSTDEGLHFGRKIDIDRIDRKIDVTIIEPDSTAQAMVTYTLQGQFLRDSSGVITSKPLTHQLARFITFEKKQNAVTGERWRRTSTSAAFGNSGNMTSVGFVEASNLVLDSLLIVTPRDTILITDPLEFAFYENHPIVLHQFESILIEGKVRNTQNILDIPVGFVTIGRNKAQLVRSKEPLTNVGGGRFVKLVTVGFSAQPHFSQLVIDFLTLSTITTRTQRYDSFLIFIPIRIE